MPERLDTNDSEFQPPDDEVAVSIPTISPDFVLKESLHLQKRNDQLISVSYNNRKNMFLLLDSSGMTTWEWNNLTNKVNRVMNFKTKDSKEIIDIVYCQLHNCYFVLRPDSSISVFDREFDQVYRTSKTNRAILSMIYNPVTDELLTSAVDGLKVWKLKKCRENWRSVKPLASYALFMTKEIPVQPGQDWIRKMQIDLPNCQIYCCTTTDMYIYDFNGDLLKHYPDMHQMEITCCAYSPSAKIIITGSADTNLKIWSLTGGLIETIKAHSSALTSVLINPHNPNLVISSSIDGTIKMWSLDIMQLVYQLTLFKSEILWMGLLTLKGETLLYAASWYDVTIWSITNFIEFWAIARDRIKRIDLNYSKGKNTRLLICTEQNTVLLFNRDKAYQMSIVLPIPKLDNRTKMKSIVYCRNYDLLFILIDNNELWIYCTKTNPATHINSFNTFDIQDSLEDYEEEVSKGNQAVRLNVQKKVSNIIVQDLMKCHRAVEYGLNYLNRNDKSLVRCVSVLDSMVHFWNEEGLCCPLVRSFLLLGLENGKILFCDPLNQNRKYFTLSCSKDPVVDIHHDKLNDYLIVRIETSSLFHIEYFSLPDFDLIDEIYCLKTMTSFSRLNNKVLFGFENGSLDIDFIKHVKTKDISNRFPTESELNDILNRKYKVEHKQQIEIIDSCKRFNIFASCSLDGLIKLWDLEKNLIAEIKLDDTLSYCRFCNPYGDLLCGWRNHLFKIVLKRVLPQFDTKDDFYEENDDAFLDDSIIIEDPTLKIDNQDNEKEQQPDKMDMNKYLYPFEIDLERNGLVKVKPKIKESKEPETIKGFHYFKEEKDKDVTSQISFLSTLPSSLYSTPRENPLNDLKKIDLTLSSKITKEDIKAYLSDWISQTLIETENLKRESPNEMRNLKRDFKFPLFGTSPSMTPCATPDPPESTLQPSSKQSETKPKETPKTTLSFSLEMEKPVNKPKSSKKERKSASKKAKSDEIKQNLKASSSSSITNVVSKPPIPPQSSSQIQQVDDVYEPFKNQYRQPVSNVQTQETIKKKTNKRLTSSSLVKNRVRKSSANDSNNLTQSYEYSEISTLSNNRKKSLRDNQIESINEIRSNLQSGLSFSRENKPVNSIDSRYFNSKADSYKETIKSNRNLSARSSTRSEKSNLAILESRATRRQSSDGSVRSDIKSAESKIDDLEEFYKEKLMQEEINIREEDEDEENSQTEKNNLKNLYKNENILNDYNDLSDTTRAKHLFEYLYGLKGLPLQIRSSTFKSTNKATSSNYFNPDNSIKDTNTTDENLYERRSTIRNYTFENPYLFEWLKAHEHRSKSMHERLNRVKENNIKIKEEYQRVKSAVVERKRSIISAISQERYERRLPSASAYSFNSEKLNSTRLTRLSTASTWYSRKITNLKRDTKSAAQNETIRDDSSKRPKSVSFAISKLNDDLSKETTQSNEPKENNTVYVNDPYLISQIEMEEILKEAEQKLIEKKNLMAYKNHSKSSSDFETHLRLNSELVTQIETDDDSEFNDLSEFFTNLKDKRKLRSAKTMQSDVTTQTTQTDTTSEEALIKTTHRLSLQKRQRRKSSAKTINWEKLPEYSDSNEETSDRETSKTAMKLPLKRIRTPCSIPSKNQRYILVEMPQIHLEYTLPNSREKCLLPIRFPKLYGKIIQSLTKLDQNMMLTSKRINSATVEIA